MKIMMGDSTLHINFNHPATGVVVISLLAVVGFITYYFFLLFTGSQGNVVRVFRDAEIFLGIALGLLYMGGKKRWGFCYIEKKR